MKKTVSFAVVHFTVAFSVGWLMTGDILVGSAIAMVEPAVNTIAYYFHERVWARVPQGVTEPIGHNSQMIA